MFGRSKTYLKSNKLSPERFIDVQEGIADIANSSLLYLLDNETEFSDYQITKYERRIDLIAQELYSDTEYSWILLYINRKSIDELTKGTILKYISKSRLEYLINQIK